MKTSAKNISFRERTGTKPAITIITNCGDDWGGSEELWAKSIPYLQKDGFDIVILKDKINRSHPKYIELAQRGVVLKDLDLISKQSRSQRLLLKAWQQIKPPKKNHQLTRFEYCLRTIQPQLAVVSQGINFDGLSFAYSCLVRKIPYVIICQKAVEFYWPHFTERAYMISAFQNAKICFFVSHQNQQLTEEQFGFRFTNARIIQNPVNIPSAAIPYPSDISYFRLACIGRLFIIDKGQDILLRILAKQKWRERNILVSFIGSGVDEDGLRSMAKLLNVTNVTFNGYINDMQSVWSNHHALVLPSRSEGLPLVVLEAMAAGRIVIGTKAGGTSEFIENGVVGFIGEATTQTFEDTMEHAWQCRKEWQQMGQKAFSRIKESSIQLPEVNFANALTKLIYES